MSGSAKDNQCYFAFVRPWSVGGDVFVYTGAADSSFPATNLEDFHRHTRGRVTGSYTGGFAFDFDNADVDVAGVAVLDSNIDIVSSGNQCSLSLSDTDPFVTAVYLSAISKLTPNEIYTSMTVQHTNKGFIWSWIIDLDGIAQTDNSSGDPLVQTARSGIWIHRGAGTLPSIGWEASMLVVLIDPFRMKSPEVFTNTKWIPDVSDNIGFAIECKWSGITDVEADALAAAWDATQGGPIWFTPSCVVVKNDTSGRITNTAAYQNRGGLMYFLESPNIQGLGNDVYSASAKLAIWDK